MGHDKTLEYLYYSQNLSIIKLLRTKYQYSIEKPQNKYSTP
jgi:hypothetical protein